MVWPVWISIAALFSVFAILTKQRQRAETLAVILIGLAFVRIATEVFNSTTMWMADTIIWLVVPVLIVSIRSKISVEIIVVSTLLVLSALCLPLGRFAGENYAYGSVAIFFTDFFGASALLYLGGASIFTATRNSFGRNNRLGTDFRTSVLGHSISGGKK